MRPVRGGRRPAGPRRGEAGLPPGPGRAQGAQGLRQVLIYVYHVNIKCIMSEIVLKPCLRPGGGGGRTARGRVCGCAALRATASRAWSGGGSATAATTRPARTPGHTGRRHLHQTFGKLLYIHTYLSSNIFHKYHQYTLSISKVESFA